MRPKKDIAKDQMDMAPFRKGGRARRYEEGGEVLPDHYGVEGKSGMEEAPTSKSSASDEEPTSFKEAFRKNREAGNKTFEWKGKKYSTSTAAKKSRSDSESPVERTGTPRMDRFTSPSPEYRGSMQRQYDEARSFVNKRRAQEEAAMSGAMRPEMGGRTLGARVSGFAAGGSVSSASSRADGCAQKGKTKGRII